MTEDRTVVVTGGSAGIGWEAAAVFADARMNVVIAARNEQRGHAAAERIRTAGGEACFVPCDISNSDQVRRLFESAIARYGAVDYAFNNAGVAGDGLLSEVSEESFDRAFAINARGLWLCLREELRIMVEQKRGSIVNNASVHGLRTIFPAVGAYVASKHAAVALTKVAAMENACHGIRVNAVAPGPIETEMLYASENSVGGATAWRRLTPSGKIGTPRQVADVALWLFSEPASHINGQIIGIDGGFLAS